MGVRLEGLQADVVEPGDPEHTKMIAFLNEVHRRMGPWIYDVSGQDNEKLIGYAMATLMWVGTCIGFMRVEGIISDDDDLLEGMMVNLRAGVDVGERKTRAINAGYEAKGETIQ